MRRTTASTDEKRHAASRTRPQTGVIQRALEYAMGIHDHRRWRLRRVRDRLHPDLDTFFFLRCMILRVFFAVLI